MLIKLKKSTIQEEIILIEDVINSSILKDLKSLLI